MQRRFRLETKGFNYIYLVKPRQFGFTTDDCIDMLDDALWVPGVSCAIIAHEREILGKIFEIIKRAYDNIPNQIKPVTKYDTRNEYKFLYRYDGAKLDSEIYVALDLRGGTAQKLHVAESAYVKDRNKLKTGAKQAIPIGGRIVEESTGNGMNEFYDDVMAAFEKQQSGKSGPMDYKVIFYGWFENPEYTLPGQLPEVSEMDKIRYGDEVKLREQFKLTDGQLLWRRWKIDEMRSKQDGVVGLNAIQQFMQEYPATILEAFQSGAGNVFDLAQLMAMQSVEPHNPLSANQLLTRNWEERSAQEQQDIKEMLEKYKLLFQLGVKIWQFPKKNAKYVAGVDPSDGEGSDNTDIDIWEIPEEATSPCVQVAQFYGKIRPDKGAELAKLMCEFYNDAFIGVENNMLSFILFLSKIYDNYYTKVEIDKKTQKRTTQLGWNTNSKTRDPMIDDFIILYEDNYLIINSAVTISEMKTFVKKEDGKREHASGKHDDSLIGGMIALQMRRYEPKRGRIFTQKAAGF